VVEVGTEFDGTHDIRSDNDMVSVGFDAGLDV
jgi:hypothetical protein